MTESFRSLLIILSLMTLAACGGEFRVDQKKLASLSSGSSGGLLQSATAPNTLNGANLYSEKCSICHGDLAHSQHWGASADLIKTALATIPEMAILPDHINSDEIDAISWALNGKPSVPAAQQTQFSCKAGTQPGHSELHRLTKYELTNTVSDLLGSAIAGGLASDLDGLPADSLVLNFDSIGHAVLAEHVQGYFMLAQHAGDLVAGDPNNLSSLAGACAVGTLQDSCLQAFISSFGARAFRRPLTSGEISSIFGLAKDASTAMGDGSEAYNVAIVYFLQSPSFLYKVETGTTLAGGDPTVYALTPYETVSRLSYLIWGSMPDQELFSVAANGTIATSGVLSAEINRLMADPRAIAHFRHFYMQWLNPAAQQPFNYSPAFLSGVNPTGLAADMIHELQDYVDDTVWSQKGDFNLLMSSDAVFPRSTTLASIYGVGPWSDGQPALHTGNLGRSGVLGHAAMLATGTDASHPIKVSAALRRNILCGVLPPPNPSLFPPGTLTPPLMDGTQSTRAVFTAQTSPQACQRCHSLINPVGFALGDFDPLGRHQSQERIFDQMGNLLGTQTVDSTANVMLDGSNPVSVHGGAQLSEALGTSPTANACFVLQYFQYSAGRKQDDSDGCSLKTGYDALKANNGSIQDMIRAIATSPSFRLRKVMN